MNRNYVKFNEEAWGIVLTPTKKVPREWFPAKFVISGFYEDIGGTELDNYLNTSIATKAIKL